MLKLRLEMSRWWEVVEVEVVAVEEGEVSVECFRTRVGL